MPAVAVIADAHFHDIEGDYDFAGITVNGRRLTVRSWADTAGSTRVFNESFAALPAALDRIVARGIRHVVLLGDYSDDGQRETVASLVRLLENYRDRHGLAFYATPGNHDVFGPLGKHRDTRYVDAAGGTTLVTSNAEKAADDPGNPVVTPKMYCEGIPAGLMPMRDFGYFRRREYLHWETPFGESDDTATREHDLFSADGQTVRRLMDASYLVEPEDGLWLLMIDANVFEPRNGGRDIARKKAFIDSSDAGWNALLRVKPYLIDWIADVAARAEREDKQLLAFSHYPAVDPFEDDAQTERRLFGETNVAKRTPRRLVAETLAKAGLRLHFSGHLHVEARTRLAGLTNIAVPSLVAFPAGFVVVHAEGGAPVVESVSLAEEPLDADLLALYRAEHARAGLAPDPAMAAPDYGTFLHRHMRPLVLERFLPKEWPADMAARARRMTLWDLGLLMAGAELEQKAAAFGVDAVWMQACPLLDLIVDWYSLRQSPAQAPLYISRENLHAYRFLAEVFGDRQADPQTPRGFFALFLGVLATSLERMAQSLSA
ncbi:3',5'-cyclic AMP phosphodiesterase CpdA [Shinella sp. BE166]|uniref:metallophosphoesterase family protein n=1 Tax=Shinella sp. BE166 TaxID=3373918 RepID=UPI003EBD8F44